MFDPVREFAENLVDDLYIAKQVSERNSTDTGERISLEELCANFGYSIDDLERGDSIDN